MKKTILKTSIAAVLLGSVPTVDAAVDTYSWNGFFTMLDPNGAATFNTSYTAGGVNSYQTPISGTLSFDSTTGAGTGTLVPFDFNSDPSPFELVDIKIQAVGDGAGGPGSLVVGNMLFNWGGNNGTPLSIVLDAAGFLNGDLAGGGAGAVPAADGTYTGATFGYISLGPVPIATTEFNTSNINGCLNGDCIGNGSSGGLPLVTDNAVNNSELAQGNGVGIGGSPFQDGPFPGSSPNFDLTDMAFLSSDPGVTIAANCTFTLGDTCPTVVATPVPAAVWLFGSGLLGLIGIARRKKVVI